MSKNAMVVAKSSSLGFSFLLLLLVVLVPSTVVDGQQDQCTSLTQNFTTCLINNPQTCSGCNSSTTSSSGLGSGGFTCDGFTSSYCPTIKCCRACEAVTNDFVQTCIVDIYASVLGSTCTLDCSAYGYGYANNNLTGTCQTEEAAWLSCWINEGLNCSSCQSPNATFGSLIDFVSGNSSTCDLLSNLYCSEIGCCSNCKTQAESYFQCIYQDAFANCSATSLTNCSGNGGGATSPSAPVMAPVAAPTSSGETPSPTSSGETPSPTPSGETPSPTPSGETPSPTSPGETPSPTSTTEGGSTFSPTSPMFPNTPVDGVFNFCGNQVQTASNCITANNATCGKTCKAAVTNFTQSFIGAVANANVSFATCSAFTSAVACPLATCCAPCSNAIQDFVNCVLVQSSNATRLSNCTLNCGGSGGTSGGTATFTKFSYYLTVLAATIATGAVTFLGM